MIYKIKKIKYKSLEDNIIEGFFIWRNNAWNMVRISSDKLTLPNTIISEENIGEVDLDFQRDSGKSLKQW